MYLQVLFEESACLLSFILWHKEAHEGFTYSDFRHFALRSYSPFDAGYHMDLLHLSFQDLRSHRELPRHSTMELLSIASSRFQLS